MEDAKKRIVAREVLVAVGVCVGGLLASITSSVTLHTNEEEQWQWFFGVIAGIYLLRIVAWALKVLNTDKERLSGKK